MRRTSLLTAVAVVCAAWNTPAIYADDTEAERLKNETVEKCKETSETKPTPKMIMEKVDEAAKLIEKEGDSAFPKFKGKDSDFIFAGTYIWIHGLDDGKMLMHPIKYKLDGKVIIQMKDQNGKALFAAMNKICKEKGGGWVDYVWPKPGEKKASPKVSYVKLAKHGEKNYVVGCGVYDLTMKDVEEALGQ